jgi:hypothetical protein
MADKKISALTGATTPLAGTEVLPIVQGGATVNVSVANLTAGRAPSVSGLTVSGLTASTAVALNASKELVSVTNTGTGNNVLATTPTLVGDVTLSTGNLIVSNGKGIDFSLTPGTGTSELLSDYEEGTWTPVFTCATPGNLVFSYASQLGTYTKVGRQVTVTCAVTSSSGITHTTASGGVVITGLPFVVGVSSFDVLALWKGFTSAGYMTLSGQLVGTLGNVYLNKSGSGVANAAVAITDFPTSGVVDLYFTLTYFV